MRQTETDRNESTLRELSLLRCEQLARHAIERLGLETASRLSPRDRARLASVAAMLKEISEGLERCSARKGALGPNTEHVAQNH
ncbi:hypothetical protein [Mesorhizobium shangrilense]|uniref:Uncharacterized protein n=1 Tax=Mesorhizobium shangrilense TaxID=460060 RepID=A0ABV2D8P3_9HYPH